jgi:hypothetical protein
VPVRTSRYLNNVVAQDHRANQTPMRINGRLQVIRHCRSHDRRDRARHRIRKRQFMLSRIYRRLGKWSLKKEWAIALA